MIFASGETYHVFNRGVNRQPIFHSYKEYQRVQNAILYYRFAKVPVRFSQFMGYSASERVKIIENLEIKKELKTTIFAYCLMPNHFHFLLRQEEEKGVSRFISNFCNSFSKYINTKLKRTGPLFERPFRATHIENEEQLIHVSRYIHLNPVTSYLIESNDLPLYQWSSYQEYLSNRPKICDPSIVLSNFKNVNAYRNFVLNQVEYARELEKIKHLLLEE